MVFSHFSKKIFVYNLFILAVSFLFISNSIVISIDIQNEFIKDKNNISNINQDFNFDIKIKEIKGGNNLIITLENNGNIDYHDLEVTIRVNGGILITPRFQNFEIPILTSDGPFKTEVIKNKIFGLGFPQISISIDESGEKRVIGQAKTIVFGPFVIILETLLNEENAYNGYTLFTPEYTKKTYLIDNSGEVVHQWNSNYIQGLTTSLLENGNLIRADYSSPIHPNLLIGGFTGHIGIYNPEGEKVWDFIYSNSQHCLHHDFEVLPNGNILMIAAEYKNENEAIQNGRNPDKLNNRRLCPDYLIEVKPNGSYGGDIVWEWHVWDHLIQDYNPEKENYGDVSKHPELIDLNYGSANADWNHINSVDYNEELDQILLSVREFNEIWVIDHSTNSEQAASHSGGRYGKGGDLLYRWGNPEAYRAGDSGDQKLFMQHDARWVEEGCPGAGNILVFNNKNEKIDETNPNLRYYSTVDEIMPPVDNKGNYYRIGSAYGPLNPKWKYTSENPYDFYSSYLAGAQRLPNGNTLICEGDNGIFFEVTYEKETVWEYRNPYGIPNAVFNINRYSPDYPGIQILLN